MSSLYQLSRPGIIITGISLMLVSTSVMSKGGVDELGRLFTDAVQREKLDAVRRGTYKGEVEQKSRITNVKVNGVMIRSDGENVVWVNGESTFEGSPAQGVKVYPKEADSETFKIPVSVDGKRAIIKPGQSWSDGTGAVKDNY